MTKKVRVQLHGPTLRKSILIDAHATEGAWIGLNLFWPDGTIVTEEELRNAVNAGDDGDSIVIPPGVVNPVPGEQPPGDAIQLILGTPGEIIVTNGDGIGGDPTISIDPSFASSVAVSDWPIIKEFIAASESFLIPDRYQMLVAEEFDIEGTLDNEGTLAIL